VNSLKLPFFLCSQLRVGLNFAGAVVSHSLRGMDGLRKCRDRKDLRHPPGVVLEETVDE